MCGKPGKGRHGTSQHAKAIISNIKSFLPVEAEITYESFHYSKHEKF
jgi:hypothetical protein